MRLSRTVFEILSLIFQKLQRSHDSDQAPFRDNLSSVGWDYINMYTKFEVYLQVTIDTLNLVCSKSQPTDDKLSLKWAWSRHVTHFKLLVPLKYLWNGLS